MSDVADLLPLRFSRWFESRGWRPHPHQLAMLRAAQDGRSALLIAPTGGGKTLAGFLPSLVQLDRQPQQGLHTLYVSPLKALAVDIHRNLVEPVEQMGLTLTLETRTGDTPQAKRQRQRMKPPNMLMTTPESLALMLSFPDAAEIFAGLSTVIVDELHALEPHKRGDLLALGLARLSRLAPGARRAGLSATVGDERRLIAWLSPTGRAENAPVMLVRGPEGAEPSVKILLPEAGLPWAGHMGTHAAPEIYEAIKEARTALVFVNTRAQAELVFQALWRINDENLPIGLHHGSLSPEQRRKIEGAMAAGRLRAVVATSSLDLGIDWAAVDLVIQVGAPKGASRLIQRIGRANHRLDEPSRALLAPANRFELIECRAAIEAVRAKELDVDPPRPGALDVLCQHILGMACSAPFDADGLYSEVLRAAPYASLARKGFDDALSFVATGGYALGTYERWRRLAQDREGRWHAANGRVIRRYRMNIGTIVQSPMVKVRLGRTRLLGEVEEWFVQHLTPGDSFIFAGQHLRFDGMREMVAEVSHARGEEPKVPAYAGGRLPLTTNLARRVRAILAEPGRWHALPDSVAEWLRLQRWRSELPARDGLLVETFPRNGKAFLVAYCFEGRNAHQSLGMLLTRRMERMGLGPLGFVASDYVIGIWSLEEVGDMDALFEEDLLGDDLETWMAESSLLKRTFRNVAIIAGLVERRQPGLERTGRQLTVNSDLIYEVLRRHEPQHILLRATWADASSGLLDLSRVAEMLRRVKGRIRHRRLDRVSPLAVPTLIEIGRETVEGSANESLLAEAEAELVADAMGGDMQAEIPL
ncbi:MAG TPA: ligase-associated DNA damage response DEXH box helicase [Alphaproteobacteria bacterium]|nr:ligase-associated DNA damage response DEXH box helicase [Alphaproteobacteria bacterium]